MSFFIDCIVPATGVFLGLALLLLGFCADSLSAWTARGPQDLD